MAMYPQYGPPPGGYWQPSHPQPMRPGVLLGVSLWRMLIIAFAFIGFSKAMSRGPASDELPALSQQASLMIGIVYGLFLLFPLFTAGRRHEPKSPWLRGAVTVTAVLVGGTFLVVLKGSLDETWSLFEHLLTPLLVLIDFCFVGRNQVNARWWHPLTWLLLPTLYVIYYNANDYDFYDFPLNVKQGGFWPTLFGFVAGIVVFGYLLIGIARVKASAGAAQQQPVPPPGYGQPQNYGAPPGFGPPPQYPAPQQHPVRPPPDGNRGY